MEAEKTQEIEKQLIFHDGLNNLFARINEKGLDLRVYDSALNGHTFSKDLTKEDLSVLKSNLDKLHQKKMREISIEGLSEWATSDYTLKLTRALWPGKLKLGVYHDSPKSLLSLTIPTVDFVKIIDGALK